MGLLHILTSFGLPPMLDIPIYFCSFVIVSTWLMSLATSNVSQVDRLWTFLPPIYTAYFVFLPLFNWAPATIQRNGLNGRNLMLLGLQTVWMFRISFNSWRRGVFNFASEDYRFTHFRTTIPTWLFQIFNLVFIAIIQNLLLFSLGLPAYNVLVQGPTPLGDSDYLLAGLSLLMVAVEAVADEIQWSYQTFKRTGTYNWVGKYFKWSEEDKRRGFVTRGLWALSRHPNFACEQAFWLFMTFIPIASARFPLISRNSLWFTSPAIAHCILFYFSTSITEKISRSKYPAYASYQARVGRFLPTTTFFKGLWLGSKKDQADAEIYGKRSSVKIE